MTTQALVPVNATGRGAADPVLRAFGAWLLACLAAATTIVLVFLVYALTVDAMDNGFAFDPGAIAAGFMITAIGAAFVVFYVIMLTALPWLGLVCLAKLTRLHRGFADMVLGALMGGTLIQLLGAPLGNGGEPLTLLFAAAGAVGGLTYWNAAGRPK
ncbi:hypothetical protein [Maricaulis sp.]|uniref:hypothetical protein n=1 Tax=Maricaulis sp. TaxID=1486257 RepID=UPI00262AB1E3|nr:hypothetical protein [Maricaulis sp.]